MDKRTRSEVYAALAATAALLRIEGVEFALKGGLAATVWGEPRLTEDVDVSVFIEFGEEARVLNCLLREQAFMGDFSLDAAIRMQFARMIAKNGIGVDVAFAYPDEYYVEARRRTKIVEVVPGVSVAVFGPDDILIQKCLAGREAKDMGDISTIIARNFQTLDLVYIRRFLDMFREFVDAHDPLALFESQYGRVKRMRAMQLPGTKKANP